MNKGCGSQTVCQRCCSELTGHCGTLFSFKENTVISGIYELLKNFQLKVVYHFNIRSHYISLAPYLFKADFSVVIVIKTNAMSNYWQYGTGNEGGSVQSNSSVREVVQCPTGTHVPLVNNCGCLRVIYFFFQFICIIVFQWLLSCQNMKTC